jgi:malonyl-CoA O-methyltransferase
LAEPVFPDKRAARRSFEKAARGYDRHAVLQSEIGKRLLAHLDPIRLDPARIVDLGCGTGAAISDLRRRYPGAELVGVDFARPMLSAARMRGPRWRRLLWRSAPALARADAESLPLASACAQLAHSNLLLQWCRPQAVFAEASRVLATGGLLLFSTYGPDTLKELRAAFAAVDSAAHVHAFIDMHDLGDALVHAGFADPVMEMETLTLEYESVESLARDLKAGGGHNAMAARDRGMFGRGRWEGMVAHYERERRRGALPATYEVIYGHAWKAAPRTSADGRQVIDFRRRVAP